MIKLKMLRASSLMVFLTLLISGGLKGQDPAVGEWSGELSTQGGGSLLLIFKIEKQGEALGGTMESPDQGATGIELDTVRRKGDSLWIQVPSLQGSYRGVFVRPDSLDGEWEQMGMSYELELRKGVDAAMDSRPQTPKPPYPYRSIDTVFQQQEAGFSMGATVTMPQGDGPFPGLILVSGSGPQDRNETIMRHEPFHVIADHLTRQGFAVLRYDDRGVGASGGSFEGSLIDDFVSDARSAYRFMKGMKGVDPDRVGLLGHSEGGLVVSRLAASGSDPAFLVLLASPALQGDSTLLTQNEAILSEMGMGKDLVDARMTVLDSMMSYIRKGMDSNAIEQRMERLVPGVFGEQVDSTTIERFLENYGRYANSPWFRSFIQYDPRKTYSRLDLPVLALFGENDLQVLPGPNEREMRKAFEGDEEVDVEVIPGVNHLFQPDSSGVPSRYGQIDTTIAPKVLEKLASWLEER